MRILHLAAVVRELAPGLRKQLEYEITGRRSLGDVSWTCIALHANEPERSFEKRLPRLFRGFFLRRFYAWIFLLKSYRHYDFILCRHMTVDPFVFVFGWFIPNRVAIYHTKAVDELKLTKGLRGKTTSIAERVTGRASARRAIAVLGVTGEIARYESETHGLNCPFGVYPNGIDLVSVELLCDRRNEAVNLAFVASRFAPWHGLDRLIEALRRDKSMVVSNRLRLHLIGKLADLERNSVDQLNEGDPFVVVHGELNIELYSDILSECDVGLDSLAIDRKNLAEASSLKAREYLALGLPVYSGHPDTAIPDGHPYYEHGLVDLARIIKYARAMKAVSRKDVRDGSAQFIDKGKMMEGVCTWLSAALV